MKNNYTLQSVFCALLASMACMSVASAESLTPAEALCRYNSSATSVSLRKAPARTTLYHTETVDSEPASYLFSTGNEGFLLLSADDSTQPLLGFSDSGELPDSYDALPPAFRYWINTLSRQVALNAANGASPSLQNSLGEAIEPLTTTRWNQDLPYSYDCPVAGDRHCYTGCVATALAQIMKYHNYPPKGTGEHSYGWKNPVTEKDTTLSFNFGNTEFKWDIMADKYDRDTPWDDKAAVAELMYACGVAVNMGYGLSGSGAGTNMIAPAMINYFGYDKGVRNYIRDYYGLDEWNQIVYDQLKNFGPVQYSGFADTDGHSFIIDGYKDQGYFHVNWGWGGMSDGYFLLTALDPIDQGIGGAESAFDFSQDFIGNVSSTQTSDSIYELILLSHAYGIEQKTAKPGEKIKMWGGSFSYSAGEISDIMFGAMLIPDNGTDTLYLEGPEYAKLGQGDGVGPYEAALPNTVPAGNYKIVPAFRNGKGVWSTIPVKIGLTNSYNVVSTGSELTFSEGEAASITAADVSAPETIRLKSSFEILASLHNDTDQEFFGSLCIALFSESDPDVEIVKSGAVPVDVLPGETQEFDYKGEFNPTDNKVADGDYDLYICHIADGKYDKISEPVKVTLSSDIRVMAPTVNEDAKESEIFTIDGRKTTKNQLEKGVYIMVSPNGDRTKIALR